MGSEDNIEENKAIVRRFVDEVFVRLDSDAVDNLVADDFVSHSWGAGDDGKASLKAATQRMSEALADIHFSVEDMIAEGDRVCVRLKAGARQIGEFMGIPAQGRSYEIGEIHIFRLVEGLIVEHWHQFDAMGLMQQLKG
jgi:steroid delta-isomerase-like uncharacterized protein